MQIHGGCTPIPRSDAHLVCNPMPSAPLPQCLEDRRPYRCGRVRMDVDLIAGRLRWARALYPRAPASPCLRAPPAAAATATGSFSRCGQSPAPRRCCAAPPVPGAGPSLAKVRIPPLLLLAVSGGKKPALAPVGLFSRPHSHFAGTESVSRDDSAGSGCALMMLSASATGVPLEVVLDGSR